MSYKTGDKFVFELGERLDDGSFFGLWKIKGFDILTFSEKTLDRLGQLVNGVDQYSYTKGLEEAWELARKTVAEDDGIMALNEFTVHEAKALMEEWEKAKEIKVGDVLENYVEEQCVVTAVMEDYIDVVWCDGSVGDVKLKDLDASFTKTDRHIDLADLFSQIRG